MSIITAALVPHSPLLIPAIGKKHYGLLTKTEQAYQEIENDLYAGRTEAIVVISPHSQEGEYIGVNTGREFEIKFEEFGDFSTKFHVSGDAELARKIKEEQPRGGKIRLLRQPCLDHGAGVPLYMLTSHLKEVGTVPVRPSREGLEYHFLFGRHLKNILQRENKRIAVLASGDLSHSLTRSAPAGYSPKAAKFDQKIIDIIKNKEEFKEITEINEKTAEEVQVCALKPLAVLLGIFETIEFEPQLLSYEHPFGVGYLTMKFNL